jgi:SRSO17 transposase
MDMADFLNAACEERLQAYFDRIGEALGRPERRASFAMYAFGVLGDGERKSLEPIAARACADPERTEAVHQRLHHFALDSPWDDHAVRVEAARYALAAVTRKEPVEAWIIDDTGFIKQGVHSVGVQRQYTGSAGKVCNCQVATSLTIATRTEQVPVDMALYLPESWTEDPKRRSEARIPWDVDFATKPQLGLKLIQRAVADGLPTGLVLADSAYGSSTEFRDGIRALGLHYAVAVDPQTAVRVYDKRGRRREETISVNKLAMRIDERGGFRRTTWRHGTRGPLSARFAMRRVVWAGQARGKHRHLDQREPVWLLIEWRDGESEPANYFFCSTPEATSRKKLVRQVMQRWRTERAYQDLKGEFGLDHYEGRRFPGWHHHISVVLCCYAFVVAERARRFPPSARGTVVHDAQPLAA